MTDNKTILLVEDNDLDARSVQRALQELHVVNPLVRVDNGQAALAWLRDESHPTAGLILLDLAMPVMTGIEFLKVAKADEALRRIPVVVLTTSPSEADKLASFDLSAAGYMVKPVDYRKFVEIMRTINLYWTLSETP